MPRFTSIDEYIASFEGAPKAQLQALRAIVRSILPDAEERIVYNIPAYYVDGKLAIYFAGFKDHVSLHPGRTESEAYREVAAQYASGKSTARFPVAGPLPKKVIEDFIAIRLEELKTRSY